MDQNQGQGSIEERLNAYHEPSPAAEEVKQPEPMPSSEQVPAEVPPAPEVATPDEEKEALENSKNPERTKSYIERLKRERDEALAKTQPSTPVSEEYGSSVFDSINPSVPEVPQPQPVSTANFEFLNPAQAEAIKDQFIDKDGNVDINGLNNALKQANDRAQQAQQRVQTLEQRLTTIEESQQVKETHTVFPQLDPKGGNFNPDFYNLVRDRLVRNMWTGQKQSFLEAAGDIAKTINVTSVTQQVNPEKVKQQAVEEYKQTQQARNQGPFETGRGESRTEGPTLEELRQKSRVKGPEGDRAIAERLKRLGV